MSSIMDMITAAVIFGVLTLTVARVQSNINISAYQNQYNVIVQTNAVELARQIEWDFTKIGHRASGQKILMADSTQIRFVANLDNATVTSMLRVINVRRDRQNESVVPLPVGNLYKTICFCS